jgi:hypothetical protein
LPQSSGRRTARGFRPGWPSSLPGRRTAARSRSGCPSLPGRRSRTWGGDAAVTGTEVLRVRGVPRGRRWAACPGSAWRRGAGAAKPTRCAGAWWHRGPGHRGSGSEGGHRRTVSHRRRHGERWLPVRWRVRRSYPGSPARPAAKSSVIPSASPSPSPPARPEGVTGGVGRWDVGGRRRVALPCSCTPRFRMPGPLVSRGPVSSCPSPAHSRPGHTYPYGGSVIPARIPGRRHPPYVRVTLRLVPGRTGTSPRRRGICPERPPTLR